MSFILDALKKSESDRQQQGNAEFAGIPTSPQAPSVPRWLWVVGLLLAINLVVLLGLLLRPDPSITEQPRPLIESTAVLPPASESSQPDFAAQVAAARQNPPERQSALPIDEVESNTQDIVRPVLISQDPAAVPTRDLYPTLQEVRAGGSLDLPELHLDIHVFSQLAEDRFVFINMAKLREGSTLTEGPVVAEITPDGVVLSHQGQTFLLSRE
jgi:general secretion pathway protein B